MNKCNNNSGNNGGVGFLSLLFLLFIGLKLSGQISWSWWLVASPVWVPVVIAVPLTILVLFIQYSKDRIKKGEK